VEHVEAEHGRSARLFCFWRLSAIRSPNVDVRAPSANTSDF
jgi:hypothetical protein